MSNEAPPKVPPLFVVKTAQAIQSGLTGVARRMAPPFVHVLGLITGVWSTRVIYVAAKLELADRLAQGPRRVDDLARELGQDADALYRLMRALAMLGLFAEQEPRTFATTAYGRALESDHPHSVRECALLAGAAPSWDLPWRELSYSIETGKASLPHVFGQEIFEYLPEHPEEWALFNAWMTRIAGLNCPVIAASYPFSRYGRVVDVGGGQGMLLAQILKQHPGVRGVLYDLPDVVRNPVAIEASVAARAEIVGGDFFESVPEGADLYVMQQIIHDWDDERSARILSNCRRSMRPDGRVLIVDAVIRPGNHFDINKMLDLQMLLITGGRERTESEFRSLLSSAGLALVEIHETATMHCLIEARRADG